MNKKWKTAFFISLAAFFVSFAINVLMSYNLISDYYKRTCDSFGYENGWNEWNNITVDTRDTSSGYKRVFFVQNCFVNGPSIIFYPNGCIHSYVYKKDGKEVGKEYKYDSVGTLIEIIDHK